MKEMQHNIIAVLPDFILYLREKEYSCEESVFEDTIRLLRGQEISEESLEHFMLPLVCRSQKEYSSFHTDFRDFFHPRDTVTSEEMNEARKKLSSITEKSEQLKRAAARLDELEAQKEKAEAEYQKAQDESKKGQHTFGTRQQIEKASKMRRDTARSFPALLKKTQSECTKEILRHMDEILAGTKEVSLEEIGEAMEEIPKLMLPAAKSVQYKNLLKYLKECFLALKKIRKEKEADRSPLQRAVLQKNIAEKELLRQQETVERIRSGLPEMPEKEIEKLTAITHREVFDPDTSDNAVHSLMPGEPEILEEDFSKLSEHDRREIRTYIQDNVRRFRTKMNRAIRVRHSRRIDMPQTIKKACATDGIPIRLIRQRPVRNKTKLVMFLDISGSCRAASELMLFFMYSIQDVFPEGCRSYVFVNTLTDVTDIFRDHDAEEAIREVFRRVPTRGVYSDYGVPFRSFAENDMGKLTKDSVVFFIGDARSNRRDPAGESVRAIARRGRGAFWLNTDRKEKWNQGDSVIGLYAQYMNQTEEILTPADLIHFIETLRIA